MRKLFLVVPVFLVLLTGCAAAQGGEALRQTFDSGVRAYDAGDYTGAYRIWSAIETTDLAAMRNVAMMLRRGQGVEKNPRRAEALYETAAEAGLPTAQSDLADMLLKGEAGPRDPKRALPLLQAAAAANHPVAQFNLARMYETGELVPQDMTTARNLYAAAASHGMAEANVRLDALGPAPPVPAGTVTPGKPTSASITPPAATAAALTAQTSGTAPATTQVAAP